MCHHIYFIYHVNILRQNIHVGHCLFAGNFALPIPGNPLLAAAPFLPASSCPVGFAKSQQDLRSVCIQLWHRALWRFALYIVHLQTSGISRTQRGLPGVYAEVVSSLANCFGPETCDRGKCIALAFLSITSERWLITQLLSCWSGLLILILGLIEFLQSGVFGDTGRKSLFSLP